MCNRFLLSIYLVDQMTSGGRLSRVDVTNDDNVNVNLLLSHFGWLNLLSLKINKILISINDGFSRSQAIFYILYALIRSHLDHFTEELVDEIFSATIVATLHKVVGLLSPSTLGVVELEGPQQVSGVLEVLANGEDLVDQILNANDVAFLLKDLLNGLVVIDGLTVSLNLKKKG